MSKPNRTRNFEKLESRVALSAVPLSMPDFSDMVNGRVALHEYSRPDHHNGNMPTHGHIESSSWLISDTSQADFETSRLQAKATITYLVSTFDASHLETIKQVVKSEIAAPLAATSPESSESNASNIMDVSPPLAATSEPNSLATVLDGFAGNEGGGFFNNSVSYVFAPSESQDTTSDIAESDLVEESTSLQRSGSDVADKLLADYRLQEVTERDVLEETFAELGEDGDESDNVADNADWLSPLEKWHREQILIDEVLSGLDNPADHDAEERTAETQAEEASRYDRTADQHESHVEEKWQEANESTTGSLLVSNMVLIAATGDPNFVSTDLITSVETATSTAVVHSEADWPIGVVQCIEVGGPMQPVRVDVATPIWNTAPDGKSTVAQASVPAL
ncbi:hypothetical protein [Aeoliella mucimassa]|uniref:Uncharacterized protein n=1 Tax=Aeoliella mucimassa TaxID=2527972 RepID=A0A518AN12_9BACT|nr:hypothetical protein [Aeoliella mucimassa]QDU56114.1 hypothetical protein Pan181_23180 [Aeoliella mucimassa]